jgi:AraC family transcriptional regulator of adaptative response/methylated-DNA-[protein]-cysteine methyltransferase
LNKFKSDKCKLYSGDEIRFIVKYCSLGLMLIAQTNDGVCAIFIDDDKEFLLTTLKSRFPIWKIIEDYVLMDKLSDQIISCIDGNAAISNLKLDIHGTNFQKKVWEQICSIPVGCTTTYTALANQLGVPKSCRAVANACAANKIAVFVPCHRVLKLDGSIAGYRWGIKRKLELLRRERVTIYYI